MPPTTYHLIGSFGDSYHIDLDGKVEKSEWSNILLLQVPVKNQPFTLKYTGVTELDITPSRNVMVSFSPHEFATFHRFTISNLDLNCRSKRLMSWFGKKSSSSTGMQYSRCNPTSVNWIWCGSLLDWVVGRWRVGPFARMVAHLHKSSCFFQFPSFSGLQLWFGAERWITRSIHTIQHESHIW